MLIYVQEVLNKSEAWWGYINSAYFAGLILGGFICMKAEETIKRSLQLTIFGGSLIVGFFTFLFGSTTIGWLALTLSLLVGIGSELKMIGQITIIQHRTNKMVLPKVLSARDAILTGVFGISTLVYRVLADHFGIYALFALSSVLFIIGGVFSFFMREHLKFEKAEEDTEN